MPTNLGPLSRSLAIHGAGASCRVNFDPSSFGVVAVGDAAFSPPTARLQRGGFEHVFWECRARFAATSRPNYSVFPLRPPSGLVSHSLQSPSPFEAVDVDLAEGRGFAVRESSVLQAVTVWYVAGRRDERDGATFPAVVRLADGRVLSSTGTTMTGREPYASAEPGPAVIRMFAVPYALLDEADSDIVGIEFETEALAGSAVYDALEHRVVDSVATRWQAPAPHVQAAVRTSGWAGRASLRSFPVFTENNHPGQGSLVDGDPVGCVRTGDPKRDLFFGPGYAVSSSPTIDSLCLMWLSDVPVEGPFTVTLDDGTPVPCRLHTWRGLRGPTSTQRAAIAVNLLQVPLRDLCEALGRVPASAEVSVI
jgi:hypothetical protein